MPSERDLVRVVLFRGANVSRKPDGDPGDGAHAPPSQPDPLATEADQGGEGENTCATTALCLSVRKGILIIIHLKIIIMRCPACINIRYLRKLSTTFSQK